MVIDRWEGGEEGSEAVYLCLGCGRATRAAQDAENPLLERSLAEGRALRRRMRAWD